VLEGALQRLASLDPEPVESGEEDDAEGVEDCLCLVGGVALSAPGRKLIGKEGRCLNQLLCLADGEAYTVVRLALRALERVAVDDVYGRELLSKGAMVRRPLVRGRYSARAH
jgi:hypothetical protein